MYFRSVEFRLCATVLFPEWLQRVTEMLTLFPSSRGSSTCPWYVLGGKVTDKNLEQQMNIKFYVKIDKSASVTLALLTVGYGEYAMKTLSVFEWHRQLKEG
jgi:hypothetical protein